MSTTDAMWDSTRVIPACAVTGEAAGLAASVSRDFAALQAQLPARDIPLWQWEL